jgi:hypothetical protein
MGRKWLVPRLLTLDVPQNSFKRDIFYKRPHSETAFAFSRPTHGPRVPDAGSEPSALLFFIEKARRQNVGNYGAGFG